MQEVTNRVAQLSCGAPATPGVRAARAIVEEAGRVEARGGTAAALEFVKAAKRTPGVTLKPVIQCVPCLLSLRSMATSGALCTCYGRQQPLACTDMPQGSATTRRMCRWAQAHARLQSRRQVASLLQVAA